MNNDKINMFYEEYNFPSGARLYNILKNNDVKVTKKEVDEFLNSKKEYQLLKVKKISKNREGHITAITYEEIAQLDIYDLKKYYKHNSKYKYILALIDVFSRKVFVKPMKSKSNEDVLTSFMEILKENKYIPSVLTSDTDSTFMSKEFQKFLLKMDIIHDDVIASNDHKSLSLIDRFARTLKTVLTKLFIKNDNTNWITYLDKVIKIYNNTPHRSLEGLTPEEATQEENQHTVALINKSKMSKGSNESLKSLFNVGEHVRVRINKLFRKGTEPRYSDEIYKVESILGKRIKLDNGKIKLESELLKVDKPEEAMIQTNPIEKVNKENRVERRLKKSGVDELNIVGNKRERKPNKKYTDT
jgi:hypothetical protein